MRFVAGRGAVAERLVRGTALAELLAREPPAQRTAGRDVVAKLLLAREPPAQRTACWGAVAEQGHSRGRAPSGRCCLLWHRRCGASWQAGRGADEAAARQGRRHRARAPTMRKRCCGARAPTIRRHRRGARAANKAQAPLQSRGAGREQELARGVRS